jgi:hypothetical protein
MVARGSDGMRADAEPKLSGKLSAIVLWSTGMSLSCCVPIAVYLQVHRAELRDTSAAFCSSTEF